MLGAVLLPFPKSAEMYGHYFPKRLLQSLTQIRIQVILPLKWANLQLFNRLHFTCKLIFARNM